VAVRRREAGRRGSWVRIGSHLLGDDTRRGGVFLLVLSLFFARVDFMYLFYVIGLTVSRNFRALILV
jgi:hypothetical protein